MDVSLQVARGVVALEGDELREGDGAAISDKRSLHLTTAVGAELLLFDLARSMRWGHC